MSNLILREEKGSPLTHTELDQNLINLLLPAGVITSFGGINIPEGWLKCDGSLISRTEYTRLFNAIGELYGSGDGSTTFQLPDLRGEFIRGFDDGRGIDVLREVGSFQEDMFKSHNHRPNSGGGDFISTVGTSQGNVATGSYFRFNSRTENTGGTETRPRNVALHYIIKF